MWGTTGCDIVILGRVIVGRIVRKLEGVGDGNSVDGDDGLVGNGVILEVAHVGFGSAYSSRVVLYKRDGIGSDECDPSKIERVFRIPSLRSRRRLE